jgi:aryl-alcohol dehydrogenase-like predicted oxidoreductase
MGIPGFEWLKERVLVNEKIEKVKKLKVVADKLETNLATLSIAWCIRNPNVTTAILGATKKEQLHQNLTAIELYPKIDAEILNEIDAIMETRPHLPEH